MKNTLTKTIEPMRFYLHNSYEEYSHIWNKFIDKLKLTINDRIDAKQAIDFVIDHLNTEKIFDAIYPGSLNENTVAKVINDFASELDLKNKLAKEYQAISEFHDSLQQEVREIKDDGAKQNLIKRIYENYLHQRYDVEAMKNGAYYTPVVVVDYLLKAVAYLLKTEFNTDFSSKNVRILDPFVGTGTFITRLISEELNLISQDQLQLKCDSSQIWGNEIMLLAYYIAMINISQTINARIKKEDYYSFKNILWTDTFQLYERQVPLFNDDQNLDLIAQQQKQNINVIIGNPPYSARGNDHYVSLEGEIKKAWADTSRATAKHSIYDSYLKGIMYSIKLLLKSEPGIIAFITNNSYLDAKALDGFRKSLKTYFKKLYIIDLKGNSRKNMMRKTKIEGESIFAGTMIGTALIVGVVKKNEYDISQAKIFYQSINIGLKRQEKIAWLQKKDLAATISNGDFVELECDDDGDWFDKRNVWKPNMLPLSTRRNSKTQNWDLFKKRSNGIKFHDLNLVTNFNRYKIKHLMQDQINRFNEYVNDQTRPWPISNKARELQDKAKVLKKSEFFNEKYLHLISVAPFVFKYCYYDPFFPSQHYQFKSIFPLGQNKENFLINFGMQPFAFNTHVHLHFLLINNSTLNYPRFCYSINKQAKTLFNKLDNSNLTEQGLHYFDYVEMPSDPKLKADLIFAYIYGFLHYPEYQKHYKNNFLRQDIPRVPKPINWTIFKEISTIGQTLLNLHIYPNQAPYCPQTKFEKGSWGLPDAQYEVVKMKFKTTNNKKDKSTIIFNDYITLNNIPLKIYDWILGSKSAVEHVMSGYKRDDDKNSNPNDFAKSKNDPSTF